RMVGGMVRGGPALPPRAASGALPRRRDGPGVQRPARSPLPVFSKGHRWRHGRRIPPGYWDQEADRCRVDDGTMCRVPSPRPGPARGRAAPEVTLSAPVPSGPGETPVRAAVSVTGEISAQLTWDSFVRKYIYDPAAELINKQGQE